MIDNSLKTRNFEETIRRVLQIFSRFGFTDKVMKENINDIIQNCNEYNFAPTFFTPAMVLKNNLQFFKQIKDKNFELGIHGLVHKNYSMMDTNTQYAHLKKAIEIFKRYNFPTSGFRAPFLSVDKNTLKILKYLGVEYDSSCSIFTNLEGLEINKQTKKVLDFYNCSFNQPNTPFDEENMPRIPVSLPDDEIIIDRLKYVSSDEVEMVWKKLMFEIQDHNGHFVMQLHPERYNFIAEALHNIINEASKSNVWFASLKEVSSWHSSKSGSDMWPDGKSWAFSVTGDIDVISIFDYKYSLKKWR